MHTAHMYIIIYNGLYSCHCRSLLLCAADEAEQSVWIAAISKATPSGTRSKTRLQSFVQPQRQDDMKDSKEEKCRL